MTERRSSAAKSEPESEGEEKGEGAECGEAEARGDTMRNPRGVSPLSSSPSEEEEG